MITELQPFNAFRFDDCMAYLAAKHKQNLSLYEMMKLHTMIDVHHTLKTGMPVIGGDLWPFSYGPVARLAKNRVKDWENKFEETGEMPEGFNVVESRERPMFSAKHAPDEDDFSATELEAMDRAWEEVIKPLKSEQGFKKSQEFFHGASPIGVAWKKAKIRGGALDWDEIVDAFLAGQSKRASELKSLLRI